MRDAGRGGSDQIFAFVGVDWFEIERKVEVGALDDAGAEIVDFPGIRSQAGEGGFIGESLQPRLPART